MQHCNHINNQSGDILVHNKDTNDKYLQAAGIPATPPPNSRTQNLSSVRS